MTDDEMRAIAAPLGSKAAKIRELHKAGATASEISRFLEIRYQHTYNVLKRAGAVGPSDTSGDRPSGEYFVLELEANGSFRFPADALAAIRAAHGETLVCRAGPEGLIVTTRTSALEGLREFLRSKSPEQASLIDALLPSTP